MFHHSSISHFIDRVGREGFVAAFDGLNEELLRMGLLSPDRVPLTADTIGILLEAQELADGSGLVFPSSKRGKALSDTTISALLRANGVNCVPHGFRQSFRNFCTEEGQDRQLAEMALAHAPGDRTEA